MSITLDSVQKALSEKYKDQPDKYIQKQEFLNYIFPLSTHAEPNLTPCVTNNETSLSPATETLSSAPTENSDISSSDNSTLKDPMITALEKRVVELEKMVGKLTEAMVEQKKVAESLHAIFFANKAENGLRIHIDDLKLFGLAVQGYAAIEASIYFMVTAPWIVSAFASIILLSLDDIDLTSEPVQIGIYQTALSTTCLWGAGLFLQYTLKPWLESTFNEKFEEFSKELNGVIKDKDLATAITQSIQENYCTEVKKNCLFGVHMPSQLIHPGFKAGDIINYKKSEPS